MSCLLARPVRHPASACASIQPVQLEADPAHQPHDGDGENAYIELFSTQKRVTRQPSEEILRRKPELAPVNYSGTVLLHIFAFISPQSLPMAAFEGAP
jgi:hypothetical protein